jgi:hypothetical protein
MEQDMNGNRKGRVVIDVSVDILGLALMLFPSTYRVIGSRPNIDPGTVRLVVESGDVAEGQTVHMTCEVRDAGSTRTVPMIPLVIETEAEQIDARVAETEARIMNGARTSGRRFRL